MQNNRPLVNQNTLNSHSLSLDHVIKTADYYAQQMYITSPDFL